MLKLLLPIFITVFIISVESNKVARSADDRFKYAITGLAGKFLNKQVQANPETTLAISSFPALALLAELAIYAYGSTRKELLNIINLNNVEEIRSVLPKYIASFNSQTDVITALHFNIFADKCDIFTDAFEYDTKALLRGGTQNINYDFPETAAYIINEWGKNHTFTSKGEDVITKGEIPKDSALILVSTHDLQVNWDNPFTPRGMKDIEFHLNSNEVITMPALYGDGLLKFAVLDWLGCTAVEIPLKGGKYSVLLFSPDDGLPKLIKKLQYPDNLYKAMDMLETRCIEVYVPLGEVNAVVDLRKDLEQVISMRIFDPAAQFRGISKGSNPIYVSSMLHQLHLIGNAGVNDGNVEPTTPAPSNLCDDNSDFPTVVFDSPFVYYVMNTDYKIPMIIDKYLIENGPIPTIFLVLRVRMEAILRIKALEEK